MENNYQFGLGYIPETIKLGAAIYDFVFQGQILAGLRESKNWKQFLPQLELQYWIPFCVTFSRLNCAEAKARSEGLELNLSDRVLGVESGTTKQGNHLETVAEWFRKSGTVLEQVCSFTKEQISDGYNRWNEIYSLPESVRTAKRYFGGNHSWVMTKEGMIDALEYSPLQIAIPLISSYEEYERYGVVPNPAPAKITAYHAVTLYYIDSIGQYHIYDSCGRTFKILASDYSLTGVKSFRDLPQNWKEKNQMDEGFFKAKDGRTLVYYKKIGTPPEMVGIAQLTKYPLPLNPDGLPNFPEVEKKLVNPAEI